MSTPTGTITDDFPSTISGVDPATLAVINGILTETPPDWFAKQKYFAASVLGLTPSQLSILVESELAAVTTGIGVSNTGSGSGAIVATTGGLANLITGVTGSSTSRLTCGNATCIPSGSVWAVGTRTKVVTATDAQALLSVCGLNNTLASDNAYLIISNGVLNIRLMASSVATTVATSWAVDTTTYHDFLMTFDGTTVKAFVDGVLVGSTTTLSNLTGGASNFEANAQNGSTATSRQITVDKLFLYLKSPT